MGEHGITDVSLNTSVSLDAIFDPFLPATMAYGDLVHHDKGWLYCGGGFYAGGGVNNLCNHFDVKRYTTKKLMLYKYMNPLPKMLLF